MGSSDPAPRRDDPPGPVSSAPLPPLEYGEYAPPKPGAHLDHLPPPEPPAANAVPPWHARVTTALLIVGLFGVYSGIVSALDLRETLPLALEPYGVEALPAPDWLGVAQGALIAVTVVTYLLALVLAYRRQRAGRSALAVPLVAGGVSIVAQTIILTFVIAAVMPTA